MQDLAAVAYKSRATSQCSDIDVYYLLAQARSRNVEKDLSGVLLYDRGFFFQWLEGPSEPLRAAWERIRGDCRHAELEVVFDGSRPSRLFEGWHMQLAHRDKAQQNTVRDSITFDPRLLDELHRSPHAMPVLFAALGTTGGVSHAGPFPDPDATVGVAVPDAPVNLAKRFVLLEDRHEADRLQKLQRAGSAARAAGIGSLMNPFYQALLMPAQTGESVVDWQVKVEAWDQGWLMQDAVGLE